MGTTLSEAGIERDQFLGKKGEVTEKKGIEKG